MVSYFIVFFMLMIIPRYFKKSKTNYICSIILFIFSAIRFDVGWDFRWYYTLAKKFNYLGYNLFIDKNTVLEEISRIKDQYLWQYFRIEFLNKVLYKITWFFQEPQLIIIFYSFIIIFFLKRGLDNKKIYNYNVWLFFYTFPIFYFASLSIMRQWSAVAIVFFSYKYVERKKNLKFCICILAASLFHKTAILLLIIYFIQYIKINKNIHILLFISSFFSLKILKEILLLDIPIISKYRVYVLNSIGEGGKVIYFLIILLYLGILILIYVDNEFYEKKQTLINYVCLGSFIYISLIDLGHLGIRISQYFLIFILYIFEDIEIILKDKMKISKYFLIITEFILILMYLYSDKYQPIRTQFIPYKICFLEKDKEFKR